MSGSSVAVLEVVPGPLVHEHLVSVDPPVLSLQQDTIMQSVLFGQNVFFTGGAGKFRGSQLFRRGFFFIILLLSGTGKSFLLKAIIRRLRDKYPKPVEAVAVTSPTGSRLVLVFFLYF
jgi:hypothetical protein